MKNFKKQTASLFLKATIPFVILLTTAYISGAQNHVFKKFICKTYNEFVIQEFFIMPTGTVYIAGYDTVDNTNQLTTAILKKYDKDFNLLWEKRYGGSGWDYFNLINYIGDNRLLVRGNSSSLDGDVLNNNTYGKNEWVCIMDTNGNILHQLIYSGAQSTTRSDKVKIGPNGDIFFCGNAEGNAYDFVGNGPYDFSFDGYIACADSQLNKKWLHFFEVPQGDSWVHDFDFLPNGRLILLAGSNINNGVFTVNTPTDKGATVIMEVDTLGNIYWQKRYGHAVSRGGFMFNIYKDINKSEYYITGYANEKTGDCWDTYPYLAEAGNNYHWVMKIDTLGNKIWSHIYGAFSNNNACTIEGYCGVFDSNILLFADGVKGSDNYQFGTSIGKTDTWLIDVDSNGVLYKHRRIGYSNVRWQPLLIRQNPVTKEIYYLYYEAKGLGDLVTSPNVCDTNKNIINYMIGKYDYWPNATNEVTKNNLELKVYPNPAAQELNLEQLAKGTIVEIYMTDGKKIAALKAEKANEKISIIGWPRGTYILNASYKKQTFSQKIILQ